MVTPDTVTASNVSMLNHYQYFGVLLLLILPNGNHCRSRYEGEMRAFGGNRTRDLFFTKEVLYH